MNKNKTICNFLKQIDLQQVLPDGVQYSIENNMLKVIPSAQYAGVNFSYSPEPDSTYIISVDIEMGNSNSTDGIYITAYGVNTVSGQYGPVVVHQPVSGSGHYELTYTAPPDFVGLTKVYFTSGANTDPANPHYFFLDNFAVAKAPGPGGPPENIQCSDNFLTFNRYFPDILQHTDFHAFGMEMNGRKWQGTVNNFRFSYNGKESASELASGDYDFGERILDGRVGRWLTWDPMRSKFPSVTPYNFANDNPLLYVDEEGKENIIYLVYLPDNSPKGQKIDAYKVAAEANANFEQMGLKTRVVVVDKKVTGGEAFDASKIDYTDAVAVIGKVDKVKSYIQEKDATSSNWTTMEIPNWEGGKEAPEMSENFWFGTGASEAGGDFIAVDVNGLKTSQQNLQATPEQAAAIIIMHGAGHNADTDRKNPLGHQQDGGVMTENQITEGAKKPWSKHNHPGGVKDVIRGSKEGDGRNEMYKEKMKDRFGNKPHNDNYQKNKSTPNYKKQKPAELKKSGK